MGFLLAVLMMMICLIGRIIVIMKDLFEIRDGKVVFKEGKQ